MPLTVFVVFLHRGVTDEFHSRSHQFLNEEYSQPMSEEHLEWHLTPGQLLLLSRPHAGELPEPASEFLLAAVAKEPPGSGMVPGLLGTTVATGKAGFLERLVREGGADVNRLVMIEFDRILSSGGVRSMNDGYIQDLGMMNQRAGQDYRGRREFEISLSTRGSYIFRYRN